MTRNLRTTERVARLIIGIMLLGLFGALDAPWKYFTLIGLPMVATGLMGYCPVYARQEKLD